MGKEIEQKFLVRDLGKVKNRLLELGAEETHPRHFERNLLFDDSSGSVKNRGGILRLRQSGDKAILTVKLPPESPSDEAKVRQELQVEVSDFEEAKRLLKALGFEPWGGYEKYREEFRLGGAIVALDEMPFGDFVEIEGDLDEIKAMARSLGLNLEKRVLSGYPSLVASAKEILGLDLSFLRFDGRRWKADWEKLGIEPADLDH